MVIIVSCLSNEAPREYRTSNGTIPRFGFALWFYAVDRDDRPWRLIVFVSHVIGFTGVRMERTESPDYRESDLDEEEDPSVAPFVQVDLASALQRVDREFEKA